MTTTLAIDQFLDFEIGSNQIRENLRGFGHSKIALQPGSKTRQHQADLDRQNPI